MRLTTTSCPTIGLLIDLLRSGYQRDIIDGVALATSRRGANLLVFVGRQFADEACSMEDNFVYQSARKPAVDGAVVAMGTLVNFLGAEAGRRILRGLGVPCVSLGLGVDGVPSVGVDNRTGLRHLCQHLAEDHGYRRFAMIAGPEQNDESQERIATCQETLRERGIELGEDRITRQGFTFQSGVDGIEELFERRRLDPKGLDAIICASDLIAEGALSSLRERGVRVPEDIAITGFDDIDRARYLIPALTTVHQPLVNLGMMGARTLLQSLDGVEVPLSTTLPAVPVLRASCGCVSSAPKPLPESEGAPRSSRAKSGALQLMQRRDAICAALLRTAQGRLTADAGWESRWVMGLFSDLGDRRDRGFLASTESMLSNMAEKRSELELCQELLGVLKVEALRELDDVWACRQLEDLLHSARLMTAGALERLEVNRRLRSTEALTGALFAVERLMRAVAQDGFWEALTRDLERLGIHTCFVTRYVEGGFAKAEYVFGFSKVEPIPSMLAGRVFPAASLLPAELLKRPREFPLIVRSLVSGQRVLGTLFLSLTAGDIASYEPFAALIALQLVCTGDGRPSAG